MTNWEVSIKKLTQTKQNIYSLKINKKKLQTFDSIHFKGFNWSPSNCECECDKSCDVGKYLDYKNSRKRLVDILVEECSKNINEKKLHSNEMIYSSTLNDYEKIRSFSTVYIVLFVICFIKKYKHKHFKYKY